MNSKFLDLDKGRQDAVINASLKAFAINGYKRASTDDIVKSAGISKGLLFHYFESKKGLYEFLHDYSVKYMSMELLRDVKGEPGNIFLLQKEVERARIQVMKKYPYMQKFLNGAEKEAYTEAAQAIEHNCRNLREVYESLYEKITDNLLKAPADMERIRKILEWVSQGVLQDSLREEEVDFKKMEEELEGYMELFQECFLEQKEEEEV